MEQPKPSTRAGDALIIEIGALARRFAVKRVRPDVADDIAQDVALECLLKMQAGRWVVVPSELDDFLRRVVRRRVADWLRRCQHSGERNAEHLRDLADSVHSWMSPDLAFEERELTELCERTLDGLSNACRLKLWVGEVLYAGDADLTDEQIAALPFDLYRQGYHYYWRTHAHPLTRAQRSSTR